MAETLGSLVDKLTIKALREFYIRELMRGGKNKKFNRAELNKKLSILKSQKMSLASEIEDFITKAVNGRAMLTDNKLKLYNKPGAGIEKLKDVSAGIDRLAKKNIELWHLEDEARREDVDDAFIGRIKKRIDKANQERNDLIDAIDELFKKRIKK